MGQEAQRDSLLLLSNEKVFENLFWDFEHEETVFNSYESLKNAGKLGLIKSAALRLKLSELEEEKNGAKYMVDDRRNVHLMRINAIAENYLNFPALINRPYLNIQAGQETDYFSLLSQQHIRNLLAMKLELSNGVLISRTELHNKIIEIRQLIKRELSAR